MTPTEARIAEIREWLTADDGDTWLRFLVAQLDEAKALAVRLGDDLGLSLGVTNKLERKVAEVDANYDELASAIDDLPDPPDPRDHEQIPRVEKCQLVGKRVAELELELAAANTSCEYYRLLAQKANLYCTCADVELPDGTIEERCQGRCAYYRAKESVRRGDARNELELAEARELGSKYEDRYFSARSELATADVTIVELKARAIAAEQARDVLAEALRRFVSDEDEAHDGWTCLSCGGNGKHDEDCFALVARAALTKAGVEK